MNKFFVGAVSGILLMGALVGCGCSSRKVLSGRYVGGDGTDFEYLEFFSDGNYTSDDPNYEGDYSIDGNRIRLEGVLLESRVYYFKVKGKTLKLSHYKDFTDYDVYKK